MNQIYKYKFAQFQTVFARTIVEEKEKEKEKEKQKQKEKEKQKQIKRQKSLTTIENSRAKN